MSTYASTHIHVHIYVAMKFKAVKRDLLGELWKSTDHVMKKTDHVTKKGDHVTEC